MNDTLVLNYFKNDENKSCLQNNKILRPYELECRFCGDKITGIVLTKRIKCRCGYINMPPYRSIDKYNEVNKGCTEI